MYPEWAIRPEKLEDHEFYTFIRKKPLYGG